MNRHASLSLNRLTGLPGPKIWYSNINWEQTKSMEGIRLPRISNAEGDRLVGQMDLYQIYLADEPDTVLLSSRPDPGFLDYVRGEGAALPRIAIAAGDRSGRDERFVRSTAVPYLVDEKEERFLRSHECGWIGPPADLALRLNSKIETRRLCERVGLDVSDGRVCTGTRDIRSAIEELDARFPGSRLVAKTAYGSAGKSLFHIRRKQDADALLAYFERQVARGSGDPVVTVERWHPVRHHLSAQLFLWNGACDVLAVTEQKLTDAGVYRGSDLSPSLPPGLAERYEDRLRELGRVLLSQGYAGFLGVDSIVDDGGRLIPAVEINARLTMVSYLLKIRASLLERRYSRIETRSYDYKLDRRMDFSEFAERVRENRDPADDRSGWFVYGYHHGRSEETDRHAYRVSVLHWGIDGEAAGRSRESFERVLGQWGGLSA
ncbi:ATP-grasp domain-containing protein [Cohnella xylanilytica]|uniref:ATP-grasp domain-containing protein n=1 Tax=Cohnella xylanilytica TaxID=557555 RepID=A0A841TRY2_9BACL|nr:ATP-grasp domain-containing protein [Cohnella xylanilytica]MBB6690915.1 ATP-grasp domain-containing protein [Cohnella xylanilytica]